MTDTALEPVESKDLVPLDTIKAVDLFKPDAGAVELLIANLETSVRALAATLTVKNTKGRNAIKALAYKVTRSKTGLDEMGKEHVADLKKAAGLVDADRRTIRERLDALRDEVRKPVDDYEAHAKKCLDALDHLRSLAAFVGIATLAQIDEMIAEITPYKAVAFGWGEYLDAAAELIVEANDHLVARRKIEVKNEADRAELETLRREKMLREEAERLEREAAEQRRIEEGRRQAQQEREERIAKEAAETARRDAEMKAAREAAAAEEKAAAATKAAERAAAEAAAEAERRAESARQEEKRAAAEVQRRHDEEIAAAEALVVKAAEDVRRATETERLQRQAEAKRIADETAARERDQKNRERVLAEITLDIRDQVLVGEHIARDVANAITSGLIRNVKVEY